MFSNLYLLTTKKITDIRITGLLGIQWNPRTETPTSLDCVQQLVLANNKENNKYPRYWPFRDPVESPYRRLEMWKAFPCLVMKCYKIYITRWLTAQKPVGTDFESIIFLFWFILLHRKWPLQICRQATIAVVAWTKNFGWGAVSYSNLSITEVKFFLMIH